MKVALLQLLMMGIWGLLPLGNLGMENKVGSMQNRGRMLSRGRRRTSTSPKPNGRGLPSRKSYQKYSLESSMLGADGSDFISDSTIGTIIRNEGIISEAPQKSKVKPINVRMEPEGAQSRTHPVQGPFQKHKGSPKIRSISPRKISVIDLDMGPQEMVKVLAQEARKLEQDKTGINKGSAELACGRYSFMFHCEVVEIQQGMLEKKKDKYLYTVKDENGRDYAWNTAQGTYGRVVFGFIEVPSVGERFHTGVSAFSEFYKLPDVLTGVKVLFHGGGKYPAKYLLPGMRISVAIKSYFRGLFKIGRLVWNREREILYSLSKEFWTDGSGGPLTHTPTVFSVHYQDSKSGRQEVLFQDQENRKALVSELLIMERITGQTFFEVLVYLQDSKIFAWLEQTNLWELWYKAIYKLQWTLNHIMQSFMATGYILYMHCDLNRSNILLSIPPLTFDHKRNLINIISMDPWDMRLIDLSFVWVPSSLNSRNTNSICSQVNKAAIFSDANYLYVCIIELLKVPQKDLPISKPTPLYKAVREKALRFWERLDSINEWWAVGVNFIGRNSSTHTRYKIRRPDLGGNTFNECIEGFMMMSDVFDSEAKKLGIRLSHHSFSPEAYLRGFLHLSFRISRLGLCLRTKISENWISLKTLIPSMSYFDFSVMTVSLDTSIGTGSDSVCKVNVPKSSGSGTTQGSSYVSVNLPSSVCQEVKTCMAQVEAMKSIPGDEVIKPAISVVTAENHDSDRLLRELRLESRLPESLQVVGVRMFGRFQGLRPELNLSKEVILGFLRLLAQQAKIGGVRSSHPSEEVLLGLCGQIESSGSLSSILGSRTYEAFLGYAKNYRLSKFCQLVFKPLRNTLLFSDHLNTDLGKIAETSTIVRK
ncbi:Protein kinase-like domain containing protein (HCD family) [Cryptosporidium felis]|nr:Protein kinase-like domain containing protein (HCD family) [Cryptosporidium felis]